MKTLVKYILTRKLRIPRSHYFYYVWNKNLINFNLLLVSTSCQRDFLDVYIDVASSQPRNVEDAAFMAYLQAAQSQVQTTTPFSAIQYSSSTLSRSRLLGRYCGLLATNFQLVSIHREIVLDFFSAPMASGGRPGGEIFGFNGTFQLIPDGEIN